VAQPEPLAVVDQQAQGRFRFVDKNKYGAAERIAFQLLPTYGGQSVDSFSEIHGFDCRHNRHMGGNLDHDRNFSSKRLMSGSAPLAAKLKSAPSLEKGDVP
jgi:hypothetical protein